MGFWGVAGLSLLVPSDVLCMEESQDQATQHVVGTQ